MSQEPNIPWSESFRKLNSNLLNSTFDHPILNFEDSKHLTEIFHGASEKLEFEGVEISPEVARELLITRNLKLVRQIALSMRNTFRDFDIEDLFQSGVLGLMRAVEKWDPSREFQFSTYATWHIRQAISRFTLDNYYPIRIPIHMVDKLVRVRRYLIQYIDFFDRMPENEEAADALEISLEDFLSTKESLFFYTSYEREFEKDPQRIESRLLDFEVCEVFTNPSNVLELKLLAEDLAAVFGTLSDREAGVMALRFGLIDGRCRTLDEIGGIYGVTRERIRQIESKVMAKLRHPARCEFLRDYLELADARHETSFASSKRCTDSNNELSLDGDLDNSAIFSRELFCGGW